MPTPTRPDAVDGTDAPSPRWLDEEERSAWVRLVGLSLLLPTALDSQLQRDADLTHYGYLVLAMLSEAPGRTLTMSELASYSNGSLSRLSHVVNRLEGRGWLVRSASRDDRRVNVATLTGAGWEKVRATAPGHVEHVRRTVFDHLTPEQVRQLDAIAGSVLASLDPGRRHRATPPCPEPGCPATA